MYALAATIPPPTCITGGATASGAHVDILRSLLPLPGKPHIAFHARGNWTRRHGRISLIPMVIFVATSVSDIVDELVTSLLEIEKIAKCWSRHCVDDSLRRYTKRTSFSLIVVLSEIRPAVLCETIGESSRLPLSKILNHHKFPRPVAGFGRASHALCRQRS